MDNKYCCSCGIALNVDGKKGAKFVVVTVRATHLDAAARRRNAAEFNRKPLMQILNWVVYGGESPPEYKPATVVGRNTKAPISRNHLVNLFTGKQEYLLVRNDPGPLMRRLLGMMTVRVCQGCFDEKFKDHPLQLQKAAKPEHGVA